MLALHRGLPSVSMLSMGPGYFPNYHHPNDLPEHVDWDSVAACARIAAGTIGAFERRAADLGASGPPVELRDTRPRWMSPGTMNAEGPAVSGCPR